MCPFAQQQSPASLKSFLQSSLETTPFGLNEAARRDALFPFQLSTNARDSFSPLLYMVMMLVQIFESSENGERGRTRGAGCWIWNKGGRQKNNLISSGRTPALNTKVSSSRHLRAAHHLANYNGATLWCKKLKSCDANGIDDEKRFDLLSFHISLITTSDYYIPGEKEEFEAYADWKGAQYFLNSVTSLL